MHSTYAMHSEDEMYNKLYPFINSSSFFFFFFEIWKKNASHFYLLTLH